MRCFYHREREAVAVCKNCGRGICPTCAADVGNGMACHNRCEEEVTAFNRIVSQNKAAYAKTRGAYMRTAAFYGALGLVFLAAGLTDWYGFRWLLAPAGLIFLLAASLYYTNAMNYERE